MSSVLPGNGMWSASASTVALKNVIKPKNQGMQKKKKQFDCNSFIFEKKN
tara:strand:- start:2300 stop:2449 length:150 start_codon:yes stop_codon:yes gene_type:complete